MTRAMGRTMLRTDGEEHARLRAPAHAPLRFRGFAERWGDMLTREAQGLLASQRARGHMDVLRDFAGPFAARTLKLLLGLHAARDEHLEFASQAFIDGTGNYAVAASTAMTRWGHVAALRARQPAHRGRDHR